MHSSSAQSFSGFRRFKKCGYMVAALISITALSACSSAQTIAQTKPVSVTKVGYSLPAKQPLLSGPSKTSGTTRNSKQIVTQRTAAKPAPRVTTAKYHGRAPHICTPSGFGSKPRCFNRG